MGCRIRPSAQFTVIGFDVNLVSRIQSVCGATGHPLLMSARFAALLGAEGSYSMGEHTVKGFLEAVELFALDQTIIQEVSTN